jgi:hypothetical protein
MHNPKSKARELEGSRAARGAGDEGRTRDIQLGKLTLYRLSYSRGAEEFITA